MEASQSLSFDEQVEVYLKEFNEWISTNTTLNTVSPLDFVAFCRRDETFRNHWAPLLNFNPQLDK